MNSNGNMFDEMVNFMLTNIQVPLTLQRLGDVTRKVEQKVIRCKQPTTLFFFIFWF